ncbi:MAG: HAMP domain-containing sensor histidine kinase [Eubacteriales bacterium]|nr:HAMP domain-containing sensor histidine kinase [Eubacteriales bacterium]
MWICFIVIAILICILIVMTTRLQTIKNQLKKTGKELEQTKDLDYNKMVSISLVDKDLIELTKQINDNLDYQKKMKWKAQESENQLRQSISDIAHDLRTPIAVVKGNLQMMGKETDISSKSREYLEICSEKTDLLQRMVDEFFELSYMESEETEVNMEKLDLTEFLASFVISHEPVIKLKGMEPEIILPKKSIFVMADRNLLTRMLENLFNNVVKHASETFTIALTEEEHQARVFFSNPVLAEMQFDVEHLFDRTYRGNKARTGGGPGGLGLFIVRLLAQKQNINTSAKREQNTLSIMLDFPIL